MIKIKKMETRNYKVPMEIIIEISKSFQEFGISAELNGGDDESGNVYLKINLDPKSPIHQQVRKNTERMIQTFLDYRYGGDENSDFQKEAA